MKPATEAPPDHANALIKAGRRGLDLGQPEDKSCAPQGGGRGHRGPPLSFNAGRAVSLLTVIVLILQGRKVYQEKKECTGLFFLNGSAGPGWLHDIVRCPKEQMHAGTQVTQDTQEQENPLAPYGGAHTTGVGSAAVAP